MSALRAAVSQAAKTDLKLGEMYWFIEDMLVAFYVWGILLLISFTCIEGQLYHVWNITSANLT